MPRKIKYDATEFQYDGEYGMYYDENFDSLEDIILLFKRLNDKVEILEEDKPIIEKINLDREPLKGKEVPRAIDYLLEGRINEIIDYINRKEDK